MADYKLKYTGEEIDTALTKIMELTPETWKFTVEVMNEDGTTKTEEISKEVYVANDND